MVDQSKKIFKQGSWCEKEWCLHCSSAVAGEGLESAVPKAWTTAGAAPTTPNAQVNTGNDQSRISSLEQQWRTWNHDPFRITCMKAEQNTETLLFSWLTRLQD